MLGVETHPSMSLTAFLSAPSGKWNNLKIRWGKTSFYKPSRFWELQRSWCNTTIPKTLLVLFSRGCAYVLLSVHMTAWRTGGRKTNVTPRTKVVKGQSIESRLFILLLFRNCELSRYTSLRGPMVSYQRRDINSLGSKTDIRASLASLSRPLDVFSHSQLQEVFHIGYPNIHWD